MRLLEMSISAGVLVMILMLLHAIGCSRLPKRVFVLCWMIVLVRLFLPFSLPFQKGIASPAVGLLQQVMQFTGIKENIGNKKTAFVAIQEAASSGVVNAGKSGWLDINLNLNVSIVICCLWIIGVIIFGIYFIYSFRKEQSMLAQAIPLNSVPKISGTQKWNGRTENGDCLQNLYVSACRIVGIRHRIGKKQPILTHDRLSSPLVRGIIEQQIVIPKEMLCMEEDQMKYVLAHEMVHIRRWDNLWKILSAAAVCIHWFNPAVWAMYFLLAKDLELSCDEQVLALYGRENREKYAMTLLAIAQNQKETIVFSSGFGENPTKERIVAIMKYKKLSKIGAVGAVMMLTGAVTIFAANDGTAASKGQSEHEQLESESTQTFHEDTQNDTDAQAGREDNERLTPDKDVEYMIVETAEGGKAEVKEFKFDDGLTSDKNVEYMLVETAEGGKAEIKEFKFEESTDGNKDEVMKTASESSERFTVEASEKAASETAEKAASEAREKVEYDADSTFTSFTVQEEPDELNSRVELVIKEKEDGDPDVVESHYFIEENGEEKELDLQPGEQKVTVNGKTYSILLEKDGKNVALAVAK